MASVYDNIINGSFDAVGAPPSYMTPAYNPADYASIYAPSPARGNGIWGSSRPTFSPPRSVGSPNLTASEQQLLNQQIQQSQAQSQA